MDVLRDFQLVIFFYSTTFITFSYKSLAGFLFKAARTGSGVGFLHLTAVFYNMKRLGVFSLEELIVHRRVTPIIKCTSWVKRRTMRVKCLAQENNVMRRPGLEPGPLDPVYTSVLFSHRK